MGSIIKESWENTVCASAAKAFLENVINEADYEYFKTCLKRDDELFWYFVIHFLATQPAPQVSELIQTKVGPSSCRAFGFVLEGGKLRRIYIPKALQNEALSWLNDSTKKAASFF